jgi:hypothetical protein
MTKVYNSHLTLAIISVIIGPNIFGMVALVFSIMSRESFKKNDIELSLSRAKVARIMSIGFLFLFTLIIYLNYKF